MNRKEPTEIHTILKRRENDIP